MSGISLICRKFPKKISEISKIFFNFKSFWQFEKKLINFWFNHRNFRPLAKNFRTAVIELHGPKNCKMVEFTKIVEIFDNSMKIIKHNPKISKKVLKISNKVSKNSMQIYKFKELTKNQRVQENFGNFQRRFGNC